VSQVRKVILDLEVIKVLMASEENAAIRVSEA
jgi:hypothetical protein